jgi:hypothetical protein
MACPNRKYRTCKSTMTSSMAVTLESEDESGDSAASAPYSRSRLVVASAVVRIRVRGWGASWRKLAEAIAWFSVSGLWSQTKPTYLQCPWRHSLNNGRVLGTCRPSARRLSRIWLWNAHSSSQRQRPPSAGRKPFSHYPVLFIAEGSACCSVLCVIHNINVAIEVHGKRAVDELLSPRRRNAG